jgi:hypothetical protein
MSTRTRRAVPWLLVLLSFLFVACLWPLLGTIHQIELLPAQRFDAPQSTPSPEDSSSSARINALLLGFFLLIAAGVVYVLSRVTPRAAWQAAGVILLGGLFIALTVPHLSTSLLNLLSMPEFASPDRPPQTGPDPSGASTIAPDGDRLLLPPVDVPVERSRTIDLLMAFLLAAMIVALAAAFVTWGLSRFRTRPPRHTEEARMIRSLSTAAHRLRDGDDVYGVVLRCYQEMLHLLSQEQGINATCLTPREFVRRLPTTRLSTAQIRELTTLFETVRYGSRIDDRFPARALACLASIEESHAAATP